MERRCTGIDYHEPAIARARIGSQQALVDRLARRNWSSCGAITDDGCARCGLPLCPEHMHSADRRCRSCETEYVTFRRRSDGRAALAYAALVFAAGSVGAVLGLRWGLLVVIPALALAPVFAQLAGTGRSRRRFLDERIERVTVPRARARARTPLSRRR